MKDRLTEQLRKDIVISEINGIPDIVTLRKKASDIEEEKWRIIVAAAE